MADRLTPDELAEIYKTHEEDQKGLDADAENGLIVLPPWSAHPHRAALLRHVEALEQEVERLRRNDELQMNRAIAAERKLARVRELPRHGTQEIKDEYGDDPSVMWIAEYELEAALDESGERK